MKAKSLFLGLFFLLPIYLWAQPCEITEVEAQQKPKEVTLIPVFEDKTIIYDWEVLKDLDEIQIAIEYLSEDANKIGLTRNRLKTVAELKLRREGIKITESPGVPYLYVNINVVGNAFHLDLALNEKIKILRLDAIKYGVSTWGEGAIGTHGNDPEYIVGALEGKLDTFLNDYYKANPKK